MMWQDMVFLVGSMTSVMFLYPTLRNTASQVPRATSIPSMLIGGAYSFTFFTLGMTFSAFGAFAACTMWSLIAAFRAPDSSSLLDSSRQRVNDFLATLGIDSVRLTTTRSQSSNSETGSAESPVEQQPNDGEDGLTEGLESELDITANSD